MSLSLTTNKGMCIIQADVPPQYVMSTFDRFPLPVQRYLDTAPYKLCTMCLKQFYALYQTNYFLIIAYMEAIIKGEIDASDNYYDFKHWLSARKPSRL